MTTLDNSKSADHANIERKILHYLNPRENVHLIPNIHVIIAILQLASLIALIAIAIIFVNSSKTTYFQMRDPVVNGKEMDNFVMFAMLCFFFVLDSFVARWSREIFSIWRRKYTSGPEKNLAKLVVLLTFSVIMKWIRYAAWAVFGYAQISFGVSFAIGDIAATLYINRVHISKIDLGINANLLLQTKKTVYEYIDENENIFWFFLAIQMVAIGIIQVFYLLTGFFESDYFEFGPPLRFFSVGFNNDEKYIGIVIFVFIDNLVATAADRRIGGWFFSDVFDLDNIRVGYSEGRIDYIYISNTFINWIRGIIIMNLTLAQFAFTLLFLSSELFYVLFSEISAFYGKKYATISCDFAIFLKHMQLLAILILAVVMHVWEPSVYDDGEGGTIKRGYFTPPSTFYIWGQTFTNMYIFSLLLTYAFVSRAIQTMANEILSPFIVSTVLEHDVEEIIYSNNTIRFIMWADTLCSWSNRIFAIQFVISNVYFGFATIVADISTSALILHFYYEYRQKSICELDSYEELYGSPEDVLRVVEKARRQRRSVINKKQ